MGGKGKHGHRRQPQPQRCGPKGASKILDAGPHALYLSGEHFAQRRDAMEALGIKRVVACGCDAHHAGAFAYLEVRLRDAANAKVAPHLGRAADFVAAGLREGSVLVHCKAGVCRSATLVMAYLLRHRRDVANSVGEALAVVRAARRCAAPRETFLCELERFEAENRGGARGAAALNELPAEVLGAVLGALPGADLPVAAAASRRISAAADAVAARRLEDLASFDFRPRWPGESRAVHLRRCVEDVDRQVRTWWAPDAKT